MALVRREKRHTVGWNPADRCVTAGATAGLRWVRHDTTAARWYRTLLDALGEVVIDVAKLLTEQSRVAVPQ